MDISRKTALAALLALLTLSLAGCAGEYYHHDYDVEVIDWGPVGTWPVPDPAPYPDVVVVAEQRPPRAQPLPKPVVRPGPRTKEPDREPRTPSTRTPKPRGGGAQSPKTGQVRR